MNEWMIGGLSLGVLAGFWNKIKEWFNQLIGLFIVRYVFFTNNANPVTFARIFIKENDLKYYNLTSKLMSSTIVFINTINKRYLVRYKETPSGIYWMGYRPIYLSINTAERVSFKYIRFTFDMETMIDNIVKKYNIIVQDKKVDTSKTNVNFNNFYVKKFYGTSQKKAMQGLKKNIGGTYDSDSPRAVNPRVNFASNGNERNDEASPTFVPDIFDFRNKLVDPIGYRHEEIGYNEVQKNRPIGFLEFDKDFTNNIVTDFEKWLKSERWYRENHIVWRRGWLLHGQPGTGKTATIYNLAEHYGIPIFSYDLSSMSNEELNDFWEQMVNGAPPMIALFEDIDAVFNGRQNVAKNSDLTLDCLLNVLGGVSRYDGVFVVVTSNNINAIDPAIGGVRKDIDENGSSISTRPGRIDRIFKFDNPDADAKIRIATRLLKQQANIDTVMQKGVCDSGAQFSERCIQLALREYWNE